MLSSVLKLLLLLPCTILVGCSHVVIPTAISLRTVDRGTLDFAQTGVRITQPVGLRAYADKIGVRVEVTHRDLTKPEILFVPLKMVTQNGQWYFLVGPEEAAKIRQLQATTAMWKAEERQDIMDTYYVHYDGCKTHADLDMSQRLTVALKWESGGAYRPILHKVPLHKLLKRIASKDIPLCAN